MKRILLFVIATLLACTPAYTQNILKKLGERAKNAAEQNIGNKVEKGINDILNGSDKQGDNKQTQQSQQQNSANQTSPQVQRTVSAKTETARASVAGPKLTAYSCDVFQNGEPLSKTYVDGNNAYIEAVKGKSALINDGKLYVLDSKAKTAIVLSLGDMSKGTAGVDLTITQWLGSDTPITHASEVVELDPEVIDGVKCHHYIAYTKTLQPGSANGESFQNTLDSDTEVWEHPEWGIPLQTLSGGQIRLNYKNIVPGPQPKELFEVPAGYKVEDLTDAFGALMKAAMQ